MARTIQVHVQVDRLPNVEDSGTFFQLGLRVSAAIVPDGADVATEGDASLILPWRWRAKPEDADGTWNPFDTASWKVFRVKKGTPNTFDPVTVQVLTKAEAGLDHFDETKFRARIEDEVKEILNLRGAREALEVPGQDGVITGRTAYGLAESLTSLPSPVPAGMKVWVAVTFAKDAFDDEDRFVAVPIFAAGDTPYTDDPFDDTVEDPFVVKLVPGGTGSMRPATAQVHASLPMSELAIPTGNRERMIDLSQLTIRAKSGEEFEGGDWIAEIGGRIAETIDPAARAMAVLDATIADVISIEAKDGQGSATRDALLEDAKKDGRFRTSLDRLHDPIVRPRARRSDAAPAPASAFLELLASRSPQLWPSVVPLLFSHAGAEDETRLPEAKDTLFFATSWARILGAAGVPPSPDLVPAKSATGNARVPLLDSEAELVEWLIRHWTELPAATSTNGKRRFEGTLRRIERGTGGTATVASDLFAGVADVSRIPRDPKGDVTVTIPFQFKEAEFPCTVTMELETPNSRRAGTSVKVVLVFESGQTRVTIADGAEQIAPELTVAQLLFKITLPPGGADPKPPKLEVIYPSLAAVEIPNAGAILAGRFGIAMEVIGKVLTGIDAGTITRPSIDRERLASQAQSLRAALSWAYAAPVVPGLLQGWAPIVGSPVDETFETLPLAERLANVIPKLVKASFKAAFDDAAAAAGLTDGLVLDLFTKLREEAVKDAVRLARTLVPPAFQLPDRVTEDALPLAFLIAQLQDFDPKEDLWGRLAGVGVLISRDRELAGDKWWSLNAASLHVTKLKDGIRDPLGEETAVQTNDQGSGGDKWKMNSKVDPVPLSVADVGGVRSALVKYENHSIVGEFQGMPQLDPTGQAKGPRRPEAYLFPVQNFTRMPALTFGREYGIVPYLIAHGGVLPLPLRETPRNPVKRKAADATEHNFEAKFTEPGGGFVHARKTQYLRTVPVGAPRLGEAQWPGTFPGVDPLADELPLRPPQITLAPDLPARFFFDKDRISGLLSARSKSDDAAIRIDVDEIQTEDVGPNAVLAVRVETLDEQGAPHNALTVRVKLAALIGGAAAEQLTGRLGLRIEAGKDSVEVRGLQRREDRHADDEPKEFPVTVEEKTLNVGVSGWTSAFIALTAEGAPFDTEPPTIRWAVAGAPIVLEGDRPILPPELAHAVRKVAILDGINTGAKTGPSRVELTLRRPSTSVTTYERWINGPTGRDGAADAMSIRKKIQNARDRASTLGTGDRSFDDPAVEAMFVEVVRLFPTREVALSLSRVRKLAGFEEAIEFQHPVFCKILAEVDSKALPGDALRSEIKAGTLNLKLPRGGIYEIRAYAAVPLEQPGLATRKTAERFSPAVRATWRETKDDAGAWHLGTPLALTIEVATETMPECWPSKEDGALDFKKPSFTIDLLRPPLAIDDRAILRLMPENLGAPILEKESAQEKEELLRYAASRYVNRAALLPQRWSWRGRPHPEAVVDEKPTFGTGGVTISENLGKFVDAAFIGRADDDIGAIREVTFGRAHARVPEDTKTVRPVLLEHDLDRRAGAHLWRFALRLKSRYAAMRPNHPALLRFSHTLPKRRTQWWSLIVPDRWQSGIAPRALDRPSLMLVVPLTEPLMTEGSVPPLLAVFNQELFPMFNAADGIEAVIDVARHPFPGKDDAGKKKKTKYLQEIAPDPVREGEPAPDRPVALRVDGPVGYTFDAGTEAGRFDHAGLLVSPVAEIVRPGSFARLRFRRLETPKLLVTKDAEKLAHTQVELPKDGKRFLLANATGEALEGTDPLAFPTVHEGLAFDLDVPIKEGETTLTFKFAQPADASTCAGKDGTTVSVKIAGQRLSISGSTLLGRSAEWSLPLSEVAALEMRVLASVRPKPQKAGSGETEETFKPVGDLSVRVRITPTEHATSRRPHENVWLSVLCMPLTTEESFKDRIALRVCPSDALALGVTALRLSDFAAPVWCQFAAAMSRFAVKGETNSGTVIDGVLPVSDLTVRLDGTNFKLGLTTLAEGQTLKSLKLLSTGEPDEDAQLEEPIYAVVTRFVYDAFDRLRERAIGIHALDAVGDRAEFGTRVWPEQSPEPYTNDMRGRVRFLRVLRGKTRDKGGFELAPQQFPRDFFGRETDEALDADPFDAAGLVMGISAPIEWDGVPQ